MLCSDTVVELVVDPGAVVPDLAAAAAVVAEVHLDSAAAAVADPAVAVAPAALLALPGCLSVVHMDRACLDHMFDAEGIQVDLVVLGSALVAVPDDTLPDGGKRGQYGVVVDHIQVGIDLVVEGSLVQGIAAVGKGCPAVDMTVLVVNNPGESPGQAALHTIQ